MPLSPSPYSSDTRLHVEVRCDVVSCSVQSSVMMRSTVLYTVNLGNTGSGIRILEQNFDQESGL